MDRPKHPLNVPGDFYVEAGLCLACTAPEHEAPQLVDHCEGEEGYHCYFKKQPSTQEETLLAIRAVQFGCCGAVRYGGSDPKIIARLAAIGRGDDCDNLGS